MAHHELSPSSYPAWSHCPHYEGGEANEDTHLGIVAHDLLYKAFNGDVDLANEADVADVDKDTLFCVRRAYDGINAIISDLFHGHKPWIRYHEKQVQSKSFYGTPYGTVDVLARYDNHIVIIDYKHRYSDRDYLPQLAAYASFATDSKFPLANRITLAVWYGDTATYWLHETTKEECDEIALLAIKKRIAKDAYPRKASPWCNICKYRGGCPEALGLIDKGVAIIPKDADALATIDPSKIAPMLTICSTIEKRIKAFRKWATDFAIANGGAILNEDGTPAYTIKQKQRRELDIHLLVEATKDTDITPHDIIDACSISQKSLKAMLSAKGKTTAEAEELIARASIIGVPTTELSKVK